eukprot:Gb_22438 [translate_table: standard]
MSQNIGQMALLQLPRSAIIPNCNVNLIEISDSAAVLINICNKMAAVQRMLSSNDPTIQIHILEIHPHLTRQVAYGVNLVKGNSVSEDCYVNAEVKQLENRTVGLFSIYSATSSSTQNIANYLQQNLLNNILKQPGFWSNPENAIVEAYRNTKAEILMHEMPDNSTALTAIVIDGCQLVVGHVGDSRAVLCRAGTAVQLSIDPLHDEDALINVSGDKGKGIEIKDPDVREELIDIACEFVILGSHGLWKTMGNEEAVDLIREAKNPEVAVKLLTEQAMEKGSNLDTISCIVIRFV